MVFSFLKKYQIIAKDLTPSQAKSIGKYRHCFFPVPEIDIGEALTAFDPFPLELKQVYEEIGFGFFHRRKGDINCLLDPLSLKGANLQLGYFKNDDYINQALEFCKVENRLLFFKTQSNQYFSIDRTEKQGENSIYYKGRQVKESLYDFLDSCANNEGYLQYTIKDVDRQMEKEKEKAEKEKMKNQKPVRYLGGHILVDTD